MSRWRTSFILCLLITVASMASLGCGGSGGDTSGSDVPDVADYSSGQVDNSDDQSTNSGKSGGGGNGNGIFNLAATRNNTEFGPSLECYTFYPDGTVELRHGGTANVTDTGDVSGNENAGQIEWDSGRSSSYLWNGTQYEIDGAKASEVDVCF